MELVREEGTDAVKADILLVVREDGGFEPEVWVLEACEEDTDVIAVVLVGAKADGPEDKAGALEVAGGAKPEKENPDGWAGLAEGVRLELVTADRVAGVELKPNLRLALEEMAMGTEGTG